VARIRTKAELLADVADRLDVPAFTSSTFVSVDTMTRWLNQSNRRLGALVRAAFGEDYGSRPQTISVVADTNSYDLPDDYIRTLEMYVLEGTHRGRIIERASDFTVGPPASNNGFGYRILATSVVLDPTPVAACTLVHRYLPTLFAFDAAGNAIADLADDDDYLDGINGWEEWAVLDCCRKHQAAEEKDPSVFVMEMREIEQEIKRDAKRTAAPLRLRDVYGDPE
jgi:hypothetical protein